MRKFVVIAIVVAVVGGAALYFGVFSRGGEAAAAATGRRAGRRSAAARAAAVAASAARRRPGGGGGGFPRVPMTVELGTAKRGDVAAHLTVVGNLIGLQTVDVAPRTGGRLVTVNVQLGDAGAARSAPRQGRRPRDRRAGAAGRSVAWKWRRPRSAQREADLKVAELNFDRSKNLFSRQLLAKQALDDAESRYMAAVAQLDLSKAQQSQNDARLQELRINLQNTIGGLPR